MDGLASAGAAVVGSLCVLGGARFTSRNTRATEDRKLNSSEFEVFKKAYQERMEEFEKRQEDQEAKTIKVERLLRLALRHILDLRSDMRRSAVNPTHGTPPELEALLWTLTDDEPVHVPPPGN
jgi:hypothetical protein